MPMEAFGLTHAGLERSNNEDALAIEQDLATALVADGMGGQNCGEVASAITVASVVAYLRQPAEESLGPEELLKEALRKANRDVWEAAESRPGCSGMGSTIVLAHWRGSSLWIANVGDSRAYLWRDGELAQLSYDQNVANDLRTSLGLTEEQIHQYPHRNSLTMAIGSGPDVLVRTHHQDLAPGDTILLCSDGLYGPAGDDGIAARLAAGGPLPAVVAGLIDRANRAGGPDNITVILLRYQED
jgi:serine/threonine protein phosphatase PrpC